MNLGAWQNIYQSDLQAVYSLCVLPVAFLAYRLAAAPDDSRATVPAASRFVALLTLIFAFETIVDPIATGPLIKNTPLKDTIASDLIPLLFVYLGDLRVLLLAIGVARPERSLSQNLGWAGAISLIVPIFAGISFAGVQWISPEANGQFLWMFHESAFLVLCVAFGRIWIPRHFAGETEKATFLRSIFGYSAAYYSLWLGADLLIVVGGLDLGWAIRMVPNQLYYACWVPFVYWRFFSVPASNAAR